MAAGNHGLEAKKSKKPRLHAEGVHARVHHLILKDHGTVESLEHREAMARGPDRQFSESLDTRGSVICVCMYRYIYICVYTSKYLYLHIYICLHIHI